VPRVQPDRKRSPLRDRLDEHKKVFGSDWHGTRDVETLETAGLNRNRMSFPTPRCFDLARIETLELKCKYRLIR
jgi:hypothetical protein